MGLITGIEKNSSKQALAVLIKIRFRFVFTGFQLSVKRHSCSEDRVLLLTRLAQNYMRFAASFLKLFVFQLGLASRPFFLFLP